jgi:hypothetical protein
MSSPLEKLLNLLGTGVVGYQLLEGYICLHLQLTSRGRLSRTCVVFFTSMLKKGGKY